VDTRHCLGCKSLVEVPIGFHGGGLVEDQDAEPDLLKRCPECNSSNVLPWKVRNGCPKCGEHMTEDAVQTKSVYSSDKKQTVISDLQFKKFQGDQDDLLLGLAPLKKNGTITDDELLDIKKVLATMT